MTSNLVIYIYYLLGKLGRFVEIIFLYVSSKMWLLMNKFIPRHYYILYNLYESYIDSLLKLYFSFIDPIHRYFKFVDGREMRRSLKTWSKQLNWKGEMNKHE